MDVVRIPRFLLFPAIAAFAWFAHPAYADTRNFAIVRCDETAGELVVSEEFTEEDVEVYKTPEGFQSKWMDQLVECISPPGGAPDDAVHGTYRHKTGEWKLRCTLKGAVYNVVISPWSVNDMVMGQCGAGDPDVELTVRRDKRVLIRKLQLGGACSIGPNEPFRIGTVRLFEPEKVATLDDRRIPYSDMPPLNQEKAQNLDKYPIVRSSTVTATPSVASNGYKCNETGSQQEMNACAELNFNAEDNELNKGLQNVEGVPNSHRAVDAGAGRAEMAQEP